VTIAAGFRSNEGIVLCADTEETLGDIKLWRGKIATVMYKDMRHIVAFAGAGWTDYIETAIQEVQDRLSNCSGMDEIRTHLKKGLLRFFEGHLARWAGFPESEKPFVELLIGVSTKAGGADLFYYGGTAFYSTSEKAIGSGVILANSLITEYRPSNASLDELCRLAVLVLSKVKRQVVGCGGDTHLVVLRRGGDIAFVDDDDLRRLEAEIEGKLRASNVKMRKAISSCGRVRLSWFGETAKRESKDMPPESP
jgi:hypothetical protein